MLYYIWQWNPHKARLTNHHLAVNLRRQWTCLEDAGLEGWFLWVGASGPLDDEVGSVVGCSDAGLNVISLDQVGEET